MRRVIPCPRLGNWPVAGGAARACKTWSPTRSQSHTVSQFTNCHCGRQVPPYRRTAYPQGDPDQSAHRTGRHTLRRQLPAEHAVRQHGNALLIVGAVALGLSLCPGRRQHRQYPVWPILQSLQNTIEAEKLSARRGSTNHDLGELHPPSEQASAFSIPNRSNLPSAKRRLSDLNTFRLVAH
jgi:hypothetical protein